MVANNGLVSRRLWLPLCPWLLMTLSCLLYVIVHDFPLLTMSLVVQNFEDGTVLLIACP